MKRIIESLWDGIVQIVGPMTIQNPCKKCLVKACCSVKCETTIKIERLIWPHNKIVYAKISSWMIVGSTLIIWISFISLIIINTVPP